MKAAGGSIKVTEKGIKVMPRKRGSKNREKEAIDMAFSLAEKQLRDGTASSQVITYFLKKSDTTRESLEIERLREENRLLRAKTESIENQKDFDREFREVIEAMKKYSGYHEIEE